MAKTKRQRFQAGHTQGLDVVLVLIVCTLIACAGVGYVWQKEQIVQLGKKTKRLEIRIDELKHREETLRRDGARLSTSRELETQLRRMNLGLTQPKPDQIIRLPDGAPPDNLLKAPLFSANP